jgi:hypothetical protein
MEKFVSNYGRYGGPVSSKGDNKTTHIAEVKFSGGDELAIVKAFSFVDKGWLNEAIAWALGSALGVDMPPRAILLIANPSDLESLKDPEIQTALREFGYSGPVVFWCTSKLEIDSPQAIFGYSWEACVLREDAGQKLAAFDGWIGNLDRNANNAPYWVSRSKVAAIDHEKMVFGQNWISSGPRHKDRIKKGCGETNLLEALQGALASRKVTYDDWARIVDRIRVFSEMHCDVLERLKPEIEAVIESNFNSCASCNLINFLSERAADDFIGQRLGLML